MKVPSQPGNVRFLALLGLLVLVVGLPAVNAAPALQEGGEAAAEETPATPDETPAEEPAAEAEDTVEEVLEEVLEEVESSQDERVYRGSEVSMMTEIYIPANQVHRGEVVCIGCEAVIEGEVTGDIVVVGGSLVLSGKAGHDVVCVLSDVELHDGTVIEHDFVSVLSSLDDFGASFGNERVIVEPFIPVPTVGNALGVLGAMVLWWKVLKFVVAFLVILVLALFVPERIRVLSDEFGASYGLAWIAGVGGYLALYAVQGLLIVSVIGIPVAILLHPVFLVFKIMGLAGIFHYIGARFGRSISREMSLLGAVFIGFLIFAIVLTLPHFFGFIGLTIAILLRVFFWLFFECPAVGLVLLTRAGGRPRRRLDAQPPEAPAVPTPPAPPAPSQAPAPPSSGP